LSESYLAGHAIRQAHDRFKKRRLSGAVTAENRRDFTRPDIEVYAVQNVTAPVVAIDLDKPEH
jgi:hypothetical protein